MQSRQRAPSSDEADLNAITHGIIAAAIEVHRQLGPGLLESAYRECVCYELSQMDLAFTREVQLPLCYKGLKLDCSYRIDLLVENEIVVELKSVEQVVPVHSAQLLTYLKAANKQVGLLINFNVPVLKDGIRRIVNHYTEPGPSQCEPIL
jgi:GxxExxY protein